MSAVRGSKPVSVEDYLKAEDLGDIKHEYLGGQVHAMAGANNRHNRIASNALGELHATLRGKPCQSFNSDTKVRIELRDHVRFYYPDAMVVCAGNRDEDAFQERPVVILEVLSDSTRRIDLGEKLDAYLSVPSLKVLIYIESDAAHVVLHRRKADGGFALENYPTLDLVISLPEIDTSLPVAALYERVTFED
jgi:Uma2 family endonuclease